MVSTRPGSRRAAAARRNACIAANMNHLAATDHAALLCKRILVVEDDDGLYQELRESLQDAGCEVLSSCEDLCHPIDTVPASRLDAALVDMDPPALNEPHPSRSSLAIATSRWCGSQRVARSALLP